MSLETHPSSFSGKLRSDERYRADSGKSALEFLSAQRHELRRAASLHELISSLISAAFNMVLREMIDNCGVQFRLQRLQSMVVETEMSSNRGSLETTYSIG